LDFLRDASDRFEKLRRDGDPIPPELDLEGKAVEIGGNNWSDRLGPIFIRHMDEQRKYKYKTHLVQDLLRLVRNHVRVQPQFMTQTLLFFSLSFESPRSDRAHSIATTRTYPMISSILSATYQRDTSSILQTSTLGCSSTCTLSSPTQLSTKSPCFARTLIVLIDSDRYLFATVLHPLCLACIHVHLSSSFNHSPSQLTLFFMYCIMATIVQDLRGRTSTFRATVGGHSLRLQQ